MPRLIIFSPLPPARNGIADYTRSLLEHHRRAFDCAVVIADAAPDPVDLPADVTLLRDAEYSRHAALFRDIPHLFHVGNNPDHRYMLDHLRVQPGVVVVHDLTMHHLMADSFAAHASDPDMFVDVLWRSHGAPGRVLAAQVVEEGWHNLVNHLDLNGLPFMLRRAVGAISHSWLGLTRIKALRPDLPVRRIDLFAERPEGTRAARRRLARATLGLEPEPVVFVTLGFVTPAKQVLEIMDVLAELRPHVGRFSYLVVGDSDEIAVEREARRRGLADVVRHVGYVADRDFPLYIDAADVVLNLRYPTVGETSSVLCRALGRGACVVVTDHGWYSELPDRVAAKVPPLPGGRALLLAALLMLVRVPARRHSFEAAAATWAAEALDIERIASQYHEFIASCPVLPRRLAEPIALVAAREGAAAEAPTERGRDESVLDRLRRGAALVPRQGASSRLKLSVPPGDELRAADLFDGLEIDATADPATCGLYIGSWQEIVADTMRLARFASSIEEDGVVVLHLWSDGAAVSECHDEIADLLRDLDLQILSLVREPSFQDASVDAQRTEIAVVAQRMTSRVLVGGGRG